MKVWTELWGKWIVPSLVFTILKWKKRHVSKKVGEPWTFCKQLEIDFFF